MQFAANTGFLWKELPFLDRIRAAAAAGFEAVEFHDEAQNCDLGVLREVLAETGLPVLGLNTLMGETVGLAARPGAEAEARTAFEAAVRVAETVGARAIHFTAGKASGAEAGQAYLANLEVALELWPGTVLIEPISEAAIPGYFLNHVNQAADVVDRVAHPRLKIMFDLYHIAAMGLPPVETYRDHADRIGHIQIARLSDRSDPDEEVSAIVKALVAEGYAGAFGCEYRPAATVEAGLGWRTAL